MCIFVLTWVKNIISREKTDLTEKKFELRFETKILEAVATRFELVQWACIIIIWECVIIPISLMYLSKFPSIQESNIIA